MCLGYYTGGAAYVLFCKIANFNTKLGAIICGSTLLCCCIYFSSCFLCSNRDSGSQKQERKDKPAQLLRGRFRRPKPNLGRSAGKKEVSGADKDVSDDNTDKEEKSLQSDCECSLLPDLDVSLFVIRVEPSDVWNQAQHCLVSSVFY